jgi:hypothetical protein
MKMRDNRLMCPHCGIRTWLNDYTAKVIRPSLHDFLSVATREREFLESLLPKDETP